MVNKGTSAGFVGAIGPIAPWIRPVS